MLKVMDLPRSLGVWTVALLVLGLPLCVEAHNGALAIAVPVEGIKVDGDLSDWPEGMRRYPIALPEDGDRLKGPADFQGNFRIGYNAQENALYVAVEVADESVIKAAPGGEVRFDTQDGCEVYVDVSHKEEDVPVFQCVIWGNTRVTDPTYGKGTLADVKLEVQWGERGYRYEWRLDIGRLSKGQVHLVPGSGLAFDLALWDKDQDGSATWMAWGPGVEKYRHSARLGRVWLATGETESGAGTAALQMGRIEGKVKWEDMEEGRAYGKVRIHSLASADFWVQVRPDSQGVYTAEVPIGRYRVEAGYRYRTTAGVEVEVKAEETAQVAEMSFARPPLGKTVPAGPGTTVVCPPPKVRTAGPGLRRQAFRTYTPGDGLAGIYVMSLYQDRAGGLWVGTEGGGVSRFDGASFSTLTQEHGLPSNNCWAIAEDHQGAMWFSTMRPPDQETEALCRYDGTTMTRFDTSDGLANTAVFGIDVDAAGAVWLATRGGAIRYDGHSFTTFTKEDGLAADFAVSVLVDSKGNVWLGSPGAGVSRFDGQRFVTFNTSDGLASPLVPRIREDRERRIWLCHYGGATCYDGQRFIAYPDRAVAAMDMAEDREGQIWFATDGAYANRLEGTRFVRVGAEAGLPHLSVYAVLADANGALWFGTGAGLSRYLGDQLRAFTAADFPGTGAQFGYERTAATLRSGCAAGLSAVALLERVVEEVRVFRGETPQGDDQTVVVLKVEEEGNRG